MLERSGGKLAIGVGEVRDFTGKSSINEGAVITQGGSLMVMSALGKLGQGIRIHERFDPRVGELELLYTDRRQLGTGTPHLIPEGNRTRQVPWLPYMGGSILQSQYFIVGGITEVNWSVQSGGFALRVNNVGPRARTFTMNVAADLRIVDTRSLVVMHTVSMQKQVVGHEIDTDIFRFYGSQLFDVNIGTRNLEPVQLAVRATLELGVLELVSAISNVSLEGCLDEAVAAGLVSRGYTPPSFPTSGGPDSSTPVALPPPALEPVASPPNRRRGSKGSSGSADSSSGAGDRPRASGGRAAPNASATEPVATPENAAVRAAAPAAANASRPPGRPDSASRPPIPSWMEGPFVPQQGGGSLYAPGGTTAAPPMNPPGGRSLPAEPVTSPQQRAPLPDGNAPAPAGAINVLG